ncbi:MAG: YitT family protein [Clostridium sp.]|nr:YitT family protein [Clostridium sp.]
MKELRWNKVLVTILGTVIMAAAINMVYEPMNMVVGGVSGFSIIVKRVTERFIDGGIPLWFTNAAINIPLLIAAWMIVGPKFVKKTILATVVFTVALSIIPRYDLAQGDLLLSALYGGGLSGVGLGLVFRNGGSTGGTDLLGAILHKFFPNHPVSRLLLCIDSTIILLGACLFGLNHALYAIIAAYTMSKIMEMIIEGMTFAKLAYIICDDHDNMSKELMEQVDRGVTFIEAEGAYTNQEKRMIMCVVAPKEIARLKEIVHKIDPKAFLIISDVREVFGEGFIENAY